ncbi:radical SAM protein [[Phormidium] sp. ETS-05]|uniref:radical SAM protein n=1 Tax=[Phormidium] sp. ETS-05 TaxID=222819 RepID=UPI0018EEF366|nr:radical SAM protein [[Phormidium] sp. ETS-05]
MKTQSSLYKKSEYVRVLGDNDRFLIYHSLFNNPLGTNSTIIEMLEMLSTPMTFSQLSELYEGDLEEVFSLLVARHFIVSGDQDDREVLAALHQNFLNQFQAGKNLSRLELAISNSCNFGCQHCMHFLNNEVPSRIAPSLHMSAKTAKESIDIFVDMVKKSGNNLVRVHFGNGEPLMNWATLVFALEYCDSIEDISFSYAINTNLSLLDQNKAEVLKKYNVKISTSLDGVKDGNDAIRVDRNGMGTFEVIMSKIQLLKSIGHPIDGFTVTVTDKNFHLIDQSIIDLAKEIGVKDVAMDFDLVRSIGITTESCVDKIIFLRRYANQKGLNFYGTWETPYRNLMSNSWVDAPHAFCPAMEGKTIEFNVDGTLKSCGHTNTIVGSSKNFED